MARYKLDYLMSLSPNAINKMSRQEKLLVAKELARYAKQRISRNATYYEKHPEVPRPMAYRERQQKYADKKQGIVKVKVRDVVWAEYDFSVTSKMTDNELRSKIARIRAFMRTKTSTVKGWQKQLGKFVARVKSATRREELTADEYEEIWDWYKIMESESGGYRNVEGTSDDTQEYLKDVQEEGSVHGMDETEIGAIFRLDSRGAQETKKSLTDYHKWLLKEYEEWKQANPKEDIGFAQWRLRAYEQGDNQLEKWTNPVEFYSGKY